MSNWHLLNVSDALKQLDSIESGLSQTEADTRLEKHGLNQLKEVRPRSAWKRFLDQFNNVLIYVLLACVVLTALLDEWLDASVILGVIVINATVGFLQEQKAENNLAAIKKLLSYSSRVLRDKRVRNIPSAQLVPGDIVQLEAGDKIPADVRLIRCHDLQIDESMLTGESATVRKNQATLAADVPVADRHNMGYSGTLITNGSALGLVIGTGESTELGKINQQLSNVEKPTTPLLEQLNQFGKRISLIIFALAVTTWIVGVFVHDTDKVELVLASVGLAVAAIPEGLPAIITIALAIGVQRMATRNSIVRKLASVETLGSVDTICTDKTGTLTQNLMVAEKLMVDDAEFNISGKGYATEGEVTPDPKDHEAVMRAAMIAIAANPADIEIHDDSIKLVGDPTDGAQLAFGAKVIHDWRDLRSSFTQHAHIPFSAKLPVAAYLMEANNERWIFIKGAPEHVIQFCTSAQRRDNAVEMDRQSWIDRISQLTESGYRTVGFAFAKTTQSSLKDIPSDLCFLGVLAIEDPIKLEAKLAIERCLNAGISIKMITGDHPRTAIAIAKQLGLPADQAAVTGVELDEMDDTKFTHTATNANVFARTSPEHKLRLVNSLQAKNHIVAMTGDGVNDAPALKQSDVGVAMGFRGSDVAKDASDVVITDDNFATIAQAVEEGRTIYDNIVKSLVFILPTSFAEALILTVAVFAGLPLPISPLQILWINMATTVTLALAIAFEAPETNVMNQPPRPFDQPLISKNLLMYMVWVTVVMVTGVFVLYFYYLNVLEIEDMKVVQTACVNTIVFMEAFYLLSARTFMPLVRSVRTLFTSRWILVSIALAISLQLIMTYAAPFQYLFNTVNAEPIQWLHVTLLGTSIVILAELGKPFFIRRKY